jgi:hypothetical protein
MHLWHILLDLYDSAFSKYQAIFLSIKDGKYLDRTEM